ncbi:MAG: hypothetical protein FWF76_01250 [Oscillospiraceae bacterium]|nr:hypothetical protein [Oscillospiraceae bacterium]
MYVSNINNIVATSVATTNATNTSASQNTAQQSTTNTNNVDSYVPDNSITAESLGIYNLRGRSTLSLMNESVRNFSNAGGFDAPSLWGGGFGAGYNTTSRLNQFWDDMNNMMFGADGSAGQPSNPLNFAFEAAAARVVDFIASLSNNRGDALLEPAQNAFNTMFNRIAGGMPTEVTDASRERIDELFDGWRSDIYERDNVAQD